MSSGQIADDEVLYRRIPSGKDWFEPPDRVSSFNFKLRPGEKGISVYRAVAIDVAGVLSKPNAIAGSGVATTVAGQVRALQNAKGDRLDLEVIPVNDEADPGHAEIRGPVVGKISSSAAKALRNLFTLVVPPR